MTGEGLEGSERRSIEDNLDRIHVRLRDASVGIHVVRPPAPDVDARLRELAMPERAAPLWTRWDGMELGFAQIELYALGRVRDASDEARARGRARPGDLVIGERGRDLFVLCPDPHAEGADVLLVEDDGTRLPHSSRVDRMVLALLGELSILLSEDGEFHDELFGDDGELTPDVERRLLRRHLDHDPDAPLARYRLAQSLRRAGQGRAALSELKRAARCAPEFVWVHHERGRVYLELGKERAARTAFERAAELAAEQSPDEPGLSGYLLAWACRAETDADARALLAARVQALAPGFAATQEASVREALSHEDGRSARELLSLGLAVLPGHVGLLSLRPAVDALTPAPPPAREPQQPNQEPERTPRARGSGARARNKGKGKRGRARRSNDTTRR